MLGQEVAFTNDLFTIFVYTEKEFGPRHGRSDFYAFDNLTAELIVDAKTSLIECWQEATRITQRAKVERESGSHVAVRVGAL